METLKSSTGPPTPPQRKRSSPKDIQVGEQRVRENGKERGSLEGLDGAVSDQSVKKLNENRKMILEQKLGGGSKLKKWENIDQELQHKSVDERDSRKSSHNSQSGHIPIPPPPPIAPSFTKPLHVNTDNNESGSLVSSYYSPGKNTSFYIMTIYFQSPQTIIVLYSNCSHFLLQISILQTNS